MVLTKEATLEKSQVTTLLNSFLKQFQNASSNTNPPNAAEFERLLSRNFQISINGKTVEKNLDNYLNRIQKLQKKYSQIKVSNLLEEPLISNNKATIQFEISLTPRNGPQIQLHAMAIATIENNKITEWKQVSSEKGLNHLDS